MGSLRCLHSPISPPFPFKLPPLKLSSTTLAASSSMAATPTHSKPPASSPRKRSSKTTKTSLPRVPDDTATAAPVAPATSVSVPPKKKVLVPIGYGTEEMEAVVIVDVLRRAGAEVLIASVEAELEVEGAGGVRLVADIYIASCSDQVFDLVALPGGMPGSVRLRDCKILRQIATKQSEENRLLGAICAAPAVTLLPWGLNTKKRMTCHPAFIDKLPTFWAVKSNIQVSGQLTTSRGPGTSYQFALSLVEQLFGESVAKELEKSLLMNDADDTRRREEFNLVEWSLDHNPRVLIPVANGSQDTEVVTIVDILRRANVNVVIASVEKSLQILASRGTKIVADKSIKDAAESTYDLIILPGEISGTEQLYKCKILKKLLKEQKLQGRIYGGTFSSPAMLQGQGLLEDMKATAHPSYVSKLTNESANCAKVVIDGKLITGKGLSTVADFALTIVSKLFGDARARSVAQGLVFDYRSS